MGFWSGTEYLRGGGKKRGGAGKDWEWDILRGLGRIFGGPRAVGGQGGQGRWREGKKAAGSLEEDCCGELEAKPR